VLFPPNHLHRTCWQCKRVIQLDVLGLSTSHAGANVSTSQHQGSPGAHSPPFETHENQPLTASNHGLLGEQTEPSQCARELEGMKATSEDQQPNNAHVHRSTSERALTPRSKRPSSKAVDKKILRSLHLQKLGAQSLANYHVCLLHIVICLLAFSVVGNATLFAWRGGLSLSGNSETTVSSGIPDSDGDGVPDHHDYCPRLCSAKNCSKAGWLSGRATDFDGDGCEDGLADEDRDNDGITDPADRCMKTPQHYNFVSNKLSDFDTDGCADGIEDTDDDEDGVPNTEDKCPKTLAGEKPGTDGCSDMQREDPSAYVQGPHWWDVQAAAAAKTGGNREQAEPQMTYWEEWYVLLRDGWIQVLIGAVLSEFMTWATNLASSLKGKIPTETVMTNLPLGKSSEGKVESSPSWKLFMRVSRCAACFGVVYMYNFAKRQQ